MKQLFLAVAFALFGVGVADAAVVWSKVKGSYTVKEGESEVVTDSDLTYVNKLTTLTVNGTVLFNTTTPPKMQLAGTGTCTKSNTSDWTMSVSWADWKGTWTFDGSMTISYEAAQALGNNDASSEGEPNSTAIFRNGATLNLSKQPTTANGWIYRQRIRISGTGKNGKGPIYASGITSVAQAKQLGNIVLESDVTVTAKYFIYLTSGTLELNGHKLDYVVESGTDRFFYLGAGQRVAGPGEIVLPGPVTVYQTEDIQFTESTPRTKLTFTGSTGGITFNLGSAGTCDCPDQYVDMALSGTSSITHTHSSLLSTVDPDACGIVFHGDIDIPSTATLYLNTLVGKNAAMCPMTIDGNLTGSGRLIIPNTSLSVADGVLRSFAFTGSVETLSGYFNLSQGGTVRLAHPATSGGYAGVTNFNGQIALSVGGTDAPWTTNDLAKLSHEATYIGEYSLLALDASAAPGAAAALCGSFWADSATEHETYGANTYLGSYAGEVSLAGPIASKGRFIAAGGTLRLTGDKPISIARAGAKTLNYAHEPGLLAIDGTSAVSMPAGSLITLPFATENEIGSTTLGQVGKMSVSDATFSIALPAHPTVEGSDDVWTGLTADDRALKVGATCNATGSYGVLEIGSGADVTAKITLGCGANDVGAAFQTGGIVRNIGQFKNGDRSLGPVCANSGRGYVEIDGGTWEQQGRTQFASQAGSDFLLNLKSGSFSAVRSMLDDYPTEKGWAGSFYTGGGFSHFYVAGGTVSTWGAALHTSGDSTVVFTLDGADANFTTKDNIQYNYTSGATGDLIVNLNEGVWTQAGDGTQISPKNTGSVRFFMNFNGGTFRSAVEGSVFCFNDTRENVRMTVFEGGAKFDVTGAGITVPRVLRAPKGSGVSAIPLPAALASRTFVCPPAVRISETGTGGSGAGATAVALWDRATGKVTGFRVTGAGDGYTAATATITYGSANKWTQVCTLAENARTGGLVKTGDGTLRLQGSVAGEASDYEGLTEVCAGTVTCAADYALSTNSVLCLTGGTVALGDYKAEFPSVGGTGGKLQSNSSRAMTFDHPLVGTTDGFALENITLTFDGDWTISMDDLNAGKTTVYNADVAFSTDATVTVDDFAALDPAKRYEIFRVADGKTLTGLPKFTDPTGKNKWHLRRRGNALQIATENGLYMILKY